MSEELDQLARKGRQRLQKLAAGRRAARTDDAAPTPDQRAGKVLLEASWLSHGAAIALAALPALAAALFGWLTGQKAWALLFGLLGTPLGVLLSVQLRRPIAVALLAQERALIAALPFPVHGWFEELSATPFAGRLQATLEFVNESPDDAKLDWLLAQLKDGSKRKRWTFISGEVEFSYGVDDPEPSNLLHLRWQRSLLERVLLPLHREFPLAHVRLARP